MDSFKNSLESIEEKIRLIEKQQVNEKIFKLESKARFDNNLSALKKYFPDLYTRFSSYQPPEGFKLFPTSGGKGNFIPSDAKGVPMYSDDPVEQVTKQVKKYTDEHPVFSRMKFYESTTEYSGIDKRLHIEYMHKLAHLISTTVPADEPYLSKLPSYFPTCIMFGIGLGYQLPILLNDHQFDYLFLCEPSEEAFYASLHCLDWERIIKSIDDAGQCLFIQVGINFEQFFESLVGTVWDIGAHSMVASFCYQHTPGYETNKLISTFFERFFEFHFGYGFYNDAVTGLAHCFRNVEARIPFLQAGAGEKLPSKHIPAFVVANGPSLDKSIEIIRAHQPDAVIFAAGTAFQSLCNAGIETDFHVLVERPKITYDFLLETTEKSVLAKTNLLAVDVIYPDVPKLYKWAGLSLKGPEAATAFMQIESLKTTGKILPALPSAAPLVANTALSFAMMLGFKEIYLFGVDNGYQIEGQSHSDYSIYRDPKLNNRYKIDIKGDHVLPGNLGNEVYSTSLMVSAKTQLERLISKFSRVSVYNVGEGAKLEGATPLIEDDILCMPYDGDKHEVVEKIKTDAFETLNIKEDFETKAGLNDFSELCDYLLDIGRENWSTRQEAADILKRQARVVYAYRKHSYPHLHHLLKGSMLYYQCPLLSLLYRFDDEEMSLKTFKPCFNLWLEYIEAMKKDYPKAYFKKCEYSQAVIDQLKEFESGK